MLLVHTAGMMDVSIDFTHVVKVSVGHTFGVGKFLEFVEKDVHLPFGVQVT